MDWVVIEFLVPREAIHRICWSRCWSLSKRLELRCKKRWKRPQRPTLWHTNFFLALFLAFPICSKFSFESDIVWQILIYICYVSICWGGSRAGSDFLTGPSAWSFLWSDRVHDKVAEFRGASHERIQQGILEVAWETASQSGKLDVKRMALTQWS